MSYAMFVDPVYDSDVAGEPATTAARPVRACPSPNSEDTGAQAIAKRAEHPLWASPGQSHQRVFLDIAVAARPGARVSDLTILSRSIHLVPS